jgi:hypothetical protein
MAGESSVAQLPPPGTPDFFPTLLTNIHSASPTLPLDSVVVQSILICIIAGDKHLILRTEEEDVGLVAKLATAVSAPFLQMTFWTILLLLWLLRTCRPWSAMPPMVAVTTC